MSIVRKAQSGHSADNQDGTAWLDERPAWMVNGMQACRAREHDSGW